MGYNHIDYDIVINKNNITRIKFVHIINYDSLLMGQGHMTEGFSKFLIRSHQISKWFYIFKNGTCHEKIATVSFIISRARKI